MRTGHYVESYSRRIALSDNPVTWFWIAVLIAVLVSIPLLSSAFLVSLLTRVFVAAIAAIGLNLLTGSTGQISLGQAGFLACGCYTTALLVADYGWPPALALPMSGIVSAVFSLVVGIPSLRLKGLYLAITTMAFSFVITQVINNAEAFTHGPYGVRIQNSNFLGLNLANANVFYLFSLGALILSVVLVLNILRTRPGRAFTAIRDHDIAARAMGISLAKYKLGAFAASSFIVGFAGGLMAFEFRFVTVDLFPFSLSVEALAMIIVGGLGSVPGAILGAAFLILMPEVLKAGLALLPAETTGTMIAYLVEIKGLLVGVVIILTLRYEPKGLIGMWRYMKRYWSNWPMSN